MPTATPVPTPARPEVSGYLLKLNGTYVQDGYVSFQIEGGYILVHPMTGEDGSYPLRTEVTLSYYPNNPTDGVSWAGVDSSDGAIAKVLMNKDREVVAMITP